MNLERQPIANVLGDFLEQKTLGREMQNSLWIAIGGMIVSKMVGHFLSPLCQ